MTEHLCVVCPKLYPYAPVEYYERPRVHEGCRHRMRQLLAELVDVYAQLNLERLRGHGQRISGSREAPLPLRVDVLDLIMPAHWKETGVPNDLVPLYTRAETEVQVWLPADPDAAEYVMAEIIVSQRVRKRDARGILAYGPDDTFTLRASIPAILDTWARDWQTYWWADHFLPQPTVSSLSQWLTLRLEDACDQHPAIDDFADELRAMVGTVRSTVGITAERPELLDIPCRRSSCNLLWLERMPGDDRVYCRNPDCMAVYTPTEYREWCELLAAGMTMVA